jgi:hypothetical protein
MPQLYETKSLSLTEAEIAELVLERYAQVSGLQPQQVQHVATKVQPVPNGAMTVVTFVVAAAPEAPEAPQGAEAPAAPTDSQQG